MTQKQNCSRLNLSTVSSNHKIISTNILKWIIESKELWIHEWMLFGHPTQEIQLSIILTYLFQINTWLIINLASDYSIYVLLCKCSCLIVDWLQILLYVSRTCIAEIIRVSNQVNRSVYYWYCPRKGLKLRKLAKKPYRHPRELSYGSSDFTLSWICSL